MHLPSLLLVQISTPSSSEFCPFPNAARKHEKKGFLLDVDRSLDVRLLSCNVTGHTMPCTRAFVWPKQLHPSLVLSFMSPSPISSQQDPSSLREKSSSRSSLTFLSSP